MNCPACSTTGAYVGFSTIECSNTKCRHFDIRMVVPSKLIEAERDIAESLRNLIKALEGGKYDHAPGKLMQGCALDIESLEATMKNVKFTDHHIKLRTGVTSKVVKPNWTMTTIYHPFKQDYGLHPVFSDTYRRKLYGVSE